MGKPLTFRHQNHDLPFAMEKVDRTKLYGYIEVEAVDDDGRTCELMTLCGDGRTIVAKGGRGIAFLSQEGNWLARSQLTARDLDGNRVEPVASSFAAPLPLLKKTTIEDYLSHNIKSVYALTPEGDAGPLLAELRAGDIYTFPYSFRGGLVADVGFLLAGADGTPFLCVGQETSIHFIGLDQMGAPVEDEGPDADEDEDLDFGMM
jgi:hypothetical protein